MVAGVKEHDCFHGGRLHPAAGSCLSDAADCSLVQTGGSPSTLAVLWGTGGGAGSISVSVSVFGAGGGAICGAVLVAEAASPPTFAFVSGGDDRNDPAFETPKSPKLEQAVER